MLPPEIANIPIIALRLTPRQRRLLDSAGISTIGELRDVRDSELLKVRGIGRLSLMAFFRAMEAIGVRHPDHPAAERHVHKRPTRKPAPIDLTGQTVGHLHVIGRLPVAERISGRMWLCRCKCGTIRRLATGSLTSGATRSCGCLSQRLMITSRRTFKALNAAMKKNEQRATKLADAFVRDLKAIR